MAILCEVSLNKGTHKSEGDKYRQQQQQNYWYIVHMLLLLSSHIVHIRSLYLC